MRDMLFHLRRDSRTPLQTQLRELLVSAILHGQIPAGSPLPSSRRLAESLDVARNTVALAYQELVADGFLVAQERRGYFVNGEILRGRAPAVAVVRDESGSPAWPQRFRLRPGSQRNTVKPRDWQSYRYPFIYGQIDPALFSGLFAGFTQITRGSTLINNSMLFLQPAVRRRRFISGIAAAVRTEPRATYMPRRPNGMPTTAEAGVSFPFNDWTAFPDGDQYLANVGGSAQLRSELDALRARHLDAVAQLLDAIEENRVDEYLATQFSCS